MGEHKFSGVLMYEDEPEDLSELVRAVGKIMDKMFLPLVFDDSLENEKEWREEWAAEIEESRIMIKAVVEAKIEASLLLYTQLFERWKALEKEVGAIEAAAVAKTLLVPEVRNMLFAPTL